MPTRKSDGGLAGSAPVVPGMCVPGTTSVLATPLVVWADVIGGRLAVGELTPRVPVTLDLDLQLCAPPGPTSRIDAVGRVVKTGRSVVVISVDFTDDAGRPVAVATAAFMAAGDPSLVMPPVKWETEPGGRPTERPPLTGSLAEHGRCVTVGPGVASVPRMANGLNSSNTVNGGLLALAVEEAALSLAPGVPLASLLLRYLRPVRVGPAVATARAQGAMTVVEVRDAGAGDRLAVHAVARSFPRAASR
ncbi:PaaI family thioesterase [Frankia sp. CNm7]|uniref:PaaI family thioesterase n=2 Tax=Frankia nepalensis TaxID=1836974 RepID=A0A937RFR1_9ACTN|nr:PaaI family thioesterase [Frankia nepalensis]MBL7514322.1 PaaI family thioesterase [Frankia nepalensis]MBL7517853.1 PaaI family thioesterase [Frankia nepalensis]MBL7628039.1 PaaI family thioesterase [Frankia nepalensis]